MTPCAKYKGGVKGGVLALCRKPVICQSFETTHPFCGANVDITIIPGNSSVLKEHAQITAQLIDIFKDQESRCFVKTVKTYRNFFFLSSCSLPAPARSLTFVFLVIAFYFSFLRFRLGFES